MQQKLFFLIILLCLITPTFFIAQNIAQELQNFAVKLQNITTFLTQPGKPTGIPVVEEPNFTAWKANCDNLPKYDVAKSKKPPKDTVLTFELFAKTLDAYFAATKPILENPTNWLGSTMPNSSEAWDTDPIPENIMNTPSQWQTYSPLFVPFVEKHTFKTTDIIAFHGDFHGDIHAFNNFIDTWVKAGYMDNNFKIIKDNFYIMFLGDYTDRGWYGSEIIYALLRVKLANPTQVFMVRGNHEDLNLIYRDGFVAELNRKFEDKQADILLNKINRFYNFLPMAIYLICPSTNGNYDVVQCCHGGIEIGYRPDRFLTSNARFAYVPKFMRGNGYNYIRDKAPNFGSDMQNDTSATTENGFMWSDFIVDPSGKLEPSGRGTGLFAYGRDTTKTLLEKWSIAQKEKNPAYILRAIFRAHQHVASDEDPMKQVILNFNETKKLFPDLNTTWYQAPKEDAGIAFLWSDSEKEAGSLQNILALTFSVSPGTPYDWPYDSFGLLTLKKGYDNWNMKVYRAERKNYEKG